MTQVEISHGVFVNVSQEALNKAKKAFSRPVVSRASVAKLARAEGSKTVLLGYSIKKAARASRARKTSI